MRTPRLQFALLLLGFCWFLRPAAAQLTESHPLEIIGKEQATYYQTTNGENMFVITNGVTVKYTNASGFTVLTADMATINDSTGDVFAEGNVRVQRGTQTWLGDKLHYNYKTKELDGKSFRMGQGTIFMAGKQMHGVGEGTNGIYTGTNAIITTDDYYIPLTKMRAKRFVLVPGKYIEAWDATVFAHNIPVFWWPYYKRNLEEHRSGIILFPGYRSIYGPYMLSSYYYIFSPELRGAMDLDYRERRGPGVGPDFRYNYGDWGMGTATYYYTHDRNPLADGNIPTNTIVPNNRERAYFSYNGHPETNVDIISQVAYQSDPYVIRDFFETQYDRDIQPSTFFDGNKYWNNWSLEALASPRINPFWDQVERLPEVRLDGFRQQIGSTPIFYESETTVGYYGRVFANTNNPFTNPSNAPLNYYGGRADTFHQLTLPQTFFGWLNVTPRVGGRFTYYGDETGPGATNTSNSREVFNTGMEVSFTASRVWPHVQNSFWDVDGIRHIFQPSVDYAYVPRPNVLPSQLPQYDYELTNSLRLLPLEYPEYNAIDSINSLNTIRYGLNNRVQTKRNNDIQDLFDWGIYMDWNLRPRSDQTTFSDIYNQVTLRPRSWLYFNSYTRYSIENGQFNLTQNSVTVQPNTTWSMSLGYLYLRSGTIFGAGDDLVTGALYFRFNENWGARINEYFNAQYGRLQEQDYTIYRDMRSWTAALTFRTLNNIGAPKDYTVAFTFSFKSFPRFGLGQDAVEHDSSLVGR